MRGTISMEITEEQLAIANKRGAALSRREPRAQSARYDPKEGKVVVVFSTGIEIRFLPRSVQGLETARASEVRKIEISPSGLGLHFPALDADVYLPALLSGKAGSRAWMAAQMGSIGGKATSDAKTAAARKNGKKGGRPRRPAVTAVVAAKRATR